MMTMGVGQTERIYRSSKLPLYQQLYEILRSKITRREWQPGDMIPPESELVNQYQVSRITVRQVLDMLVQEGLIYRERGRGTFVALPRVDQALMRIVTFTDDMLQRGIEPSTRLVSAGIVPAPADIAAKLQIEPGEELVNIKRLRLGNGDPMSVEDSYLIHRLVPGLLDEDVVRNPLRRLLEARYGIRWERASQVIRAVNAPADLAKLLAIPMKSAVLYIERISYTQENIPAEFLHLYHRGDRYELYNELRG